MKRTLAVILACTFLLATIAGCSSGKTSSSSGTAAKEYKDTITIATYEDPKTMDPMESNTVGISLVTRQIVEPLLYEDPLGSGKIEPRLATSWEYLDDLTLRFHLRKDVTFHDGGKFTAADVVFSFKRAKANPISASTLVYFDLDNTKIVDDYTLDLKFTQPYAAIFNTLGGGRCSIVEKAAVEKMGDAAYARAPIGTGPYKFVSWQTAAKITLVRNDNYWGTKALTKNVVFNVITEGASRVIELETGNADIANSIAGSDAKRVGQIKGVKAVVGQSNRYCLVTFSMQDKVLSNKDLRYALSYAIDKKSLANAVYGDTATVATGYMPSNVFGFKEFGMLPYDVAKAKELMKSAGYENGLTIDLLIDGTDEFKRCAEAIQNMWSVIGVKTNITSMAVATYLAQGSHIQAALRSGNANEAGNIFIIYESAFKDRLQSNNADLDKKLAAAKTILDATKRKAAYGEIQDWLNDQRYTVPFAYTPSIYGVSDKVEGFVFHPSYGIELAPIKVAK